MPSLSSLIVQRQVASIAEVEQAIARQVIHGGDFLTNLLEVAPHAERRAGAVLGELLGLPFAPPGRLDPPDNDVLALVPMDLALRALVFPLRVEDDLLVLATSDLLRAQVEEDLRDVTRLPLALVATPLIRVREGIAAHYGAPLDARQLRLVELLDGMLRSHPPAPVLPPASKSFGAPDMHLETRLPSGVSSPPPPVEAAPPTRRRVSREFLPVDAGWTAGPEPTVSIQGEHAAAVHAPSEPEIEPAPVTEAAPALAAQSEPPPRRVAASTPAPPEDRLAMTSPADDPGDAEGRATIAGDAAPPTVPATDLAAQLAAAELPPREDLVTDAPVTDESPRPPGMLDKRALATLLKREAGSKKVKARTARRKGPFARTDAERELESSRTPDEILDTFFAFGSQFFEYAALFVVHGDLLEGRDAWGPGADHMRVLGLGVPLDLPSSLQAVRTTGQVTLSRFDEHEIDREFRRDLQRVPRRSSLAAVVPVTIRSRAVGMLYGDDGDVDVTLGTLGELLGFSSLASAHVERLLRAKKGKVGPVPRAQPKSVAALARAFALPGAPEAAPMSSSIPASVAAGMLVRRDEARVSPGAASVVPPPLEAQAPAPLARRSEAPREARASRPEGLLDAEPVDSLARARVQSFDEEPGAALPPVLSSNPPPARSSAQPAGAAIGAPAASRSAPPRSLPDPLARPESFGAIETIPTEPEESPPPISREVRPVPFESARPRASVSFDEQAALASAELRWKPPRGGFVPPIPREEDEDASNLVAEQSSLGEAPLRFTAEPEPSDGRAGSYHIVPRPAEARRRTEAGDIDGLLHRALVGGLEGEEALGELLAMPDTELPRLLAKFPGPLSIDRLRVRADIPPASECGPLLKVVSVLRRASLPFVTVRSTSSDLEQRFWATHILGELLYPESSSAVLPRLFDDDVAVRRVARRAAQALVAAGPPGDPLTQSLDHTMRNVEEPMHRRLLSVEALVDIRASLVVPILIGGLRDASDTIIEAARTGLIVVARQDLGKSPDVWFAWWTANRERHRVEWLIDALTHETHSIRRAAGEELKVLTREYFGYYDDLPARERERAQERYRQWWTDDGMYRFR